MKKIFFTAFVAAAFAFGMTACNNNANEEAVDSTATDTTEVCEHECHHECTCADTTCAANNCETCVNKGTENCCKAKAGEQCCENHEGCQHHEGCAHEGEACCEHQHEGCAHEWQHNK